MSAYTDLIAHLAERCVELKYTPETCFILRHEMAAIMEARREHVTDTISDTLDALLNTVTETINLSLPTHAVGYDFEHALEAACRKAIKDDLENAIAEAREVIQSENTYLRASGQLASAL